MIRPFIFIVVAAMIDVAWAYAPELYVRTDRMPRRHAPTAVAAWCRARFDR